MTWKQSDVSHRLVHRSLGGGGSSWTKGEIRRARQVSLKPVLQSLGYQLQPLQNGNYVLLRLATEIVVKDHYWVCKDQETADCVRKTAGNAIDFLVEVQGMSFNQAMDMLLSTARQPKPSQ
jgi:hypothetical protein